MTRLLVLRPEPGASATVAAAGALGWQAISAPLFVIRPVEPDRTGHTGPEALLFTSANAVRAISATLLETPFVPSPSKHRSPNSGSEEGPPVDKPGVNGEEADHPFRYVPVYAVGEVTAAAARAAGFARVVAGSDDAAAIVARAASDGMRRLLHLAGREHRAVTHPAVTIDRAIVYASDAVARLPDRARTALEQGAVALLHSPRAAALFARLLDDAGMARGRAAIAALSPAVAAAAGPGWRASAVAARPTDAALLAAAVKLCE